MILALVLLYFFIGNGLACFMMGMCHEDAKLKPLGWAVFGIGIVFAWPLLVIIHILDLD